MTKITRMRFNTNMSLKKIILIGSVATIGLGIAGTAVIAKKFREKRNAGADIPDNFEDFLLKQLSDLAEGLGDETEDEDEPEAEGSETDSDVKDDEADTQDSKFDKDVEIELDDDAYDVALYDDESTIELSDFQATILGIANKPLGSVVKLNGSSYIFIKKYEVNDNIFRLYKLSTY